MMRIPLASVPCVPQAHTVHLPGEGSALCLSWLDPSQRYLGVGNMGDLLL